MFTTIQNLSPSYVTCSLIPKPYGTFIVRYPKENDRIISSIRHENQEPSTSQYVILSIRVDETIYKQPIKHYQLPYTEENILEDIQKILERYNHQQSKINNGKFPLLKEYIPPSNDENWFLNAKQFNRGNFKEIRNRGQHNSGIFKAVWQYDSRNQIKICIKRFEKNNSYFKHESSLLKDLSHSPIITLFGQYSDNKGSYLVFEDGGRCLMELCPLNMESQGAKIRFIANVGFQVAYAMMYLEAKNIIHRDLTASNVLINSHGFIRVADFGHAIKKEEGVNTLERVEQTDIIRCFLYRFLAPECLPGPGKEIAENGSLDNHSENRCIRFSSQSDVWSFGILLIQLMIDEPRCPYPQISDALTMPKYVKQEGQIHPKPEGCPTDMYLILEGCWAYEANKRLSFADIRQKMFQLERILCGQI